MEHRIGDREGAHRSHQIGIHHQAVPGLEAVPDIDNADDGDRTGRQSHDDTVLNEIIDCEWNENDEYDQRAAERRFDQEFGDIVDGIPWICDSSCHTYLKSMIFLLGVTASC